MIIDEIYKDMSNISYHAGKLEKVNLHKNIAEIQKEITKLEHEVKDFMNDNYVEFNEKLARDIHLVKKSEQLLEEIGILQSRINDQVRCIIVYHLKYNEAGLHQHYFSFK